MVATMSRRRLVGWDTLPPLTGIGEVLRPAKPSSVLAHPYHVRDRYSKWKAYSTKTRLHSRPAVSCSFCGTTPKQEKPKVALKGWWYRRLPVVGLQFPDAQQACPKCKAALDAGKTLRQLPRSLYR